MNAAEKIAGAYLRLNGFFLLPHFTIFDGVQHNHFDAIALRPGGGKETINSLELIRDDSLNDILSELGIYNQDLVGALVEVKSNEKKDKITKEQEDYAKKFFGDIEKIVKIFFSDKRTKISIKCTSIFIPIKYAIQWIDTRIEWMDENELHLSKSGSWNWSEETLSDLIYLYRFKKTSKNISTKSGNEKKIEDDPNSEE